MFQKVGVSAYKISGGVPHFVLSLLSSATQSRINAAELNKLKKAELIELSTKLQNEPVVLISFVIHSGEDVDVFD